MRSIKRSPTMDNKNMNSRVSFVLKPRYKITGHLKSINRIAWSLDGTILATPSNDTTIRLWDTQIGQHLKTLIGHTNIVSSVAWSPTGSMLASGSADSTIRLWDIQTGQSQLILTGHAAAVLSVAW